MFIFFDQLALFVNEYVKKIYEYNNVAFFMNKIQR